MYLALPGIHAYRRAGDVNEPESHAHANAVLLRLCCSDADACRRNASMLSRSYCAGASDLQFTSDINNDQVTRVQIACHTRQHGSFEEQACCRLASIHDRGVRLKPCCTSMINLVHCIRRVVHGGWLDASKAISIQEVRAVQQTCARTHHLQTHTRLSGEYWSVGDVLWHKFAEDAAPPGRKNKLLVLSQPPCITA